MSWKIVDFKHPMSAGWRENDASEKITYGPLPVKRWVPDGKRYKLKHKVARATHDPCEADEYNERKAKAYALWLAQRGGIAIPTYGVNKCRAVWSGIVSAYKTRNVKYWSGVRTQPTFLKRIEAVEWGHAEPQYFKRKDGRRGAWTHDKWVCELRITIPNWDWEPAEPVETFHSQEEAA